MELRSAISRRNLLGLLAASAGGMLAGCSFTGDTAEEGDASPQNTVVFTSPGHSDSSPSGAPTETPADSPAAVFDGGGTQAFVDALNELNDMGGGTLEIATDTYQFEPITGEYPSGPHASLESLDGVTIEGNGATIEFASPTMKGLDFTGGGDLTIRELTFDYQPVPFSQGTIESVSPDDGTLRLSLDEGFPSLEHEMFDVPDDVTALIHRPDGEFIRGVRREGRWDPAFAEMERVEEGRYDLRLTADSSLTGLRPGRRLTVLARNNRSALYFYKVDGLVVENVTVRAANGAAFGTGVCRDPVFSDCVIAPPPSSDRQISADADGIRIINALSSTTIEGCRHEKLGDDSLVVQHTMGKITGFEDDRTVSVANTHPFVLKVSDTLDALSPTGIPKEGLPAVASIEDRFQTYPGERSKPASITFEAPIRDRLDVGDFLRVRETGSQNFTVRNNEFRDHRANLIRIAASDGTIEDNVLEGCSINPIELETDTSGFFAPKGWVRNVTVQNNDISRAGLNYVTDRHSAGIRLHHRPAPGTPTEGRPNRNVTIQNNTIENGASIGLKVDAAESIRIEGNELSELNQLEFDSWSSYAIGVADSAAVSVTGNDVTGRSETLSGFGWQRESSNVTTADNSVRIDGAAKSATLTEWIPLTFSFDQTLSWAERNPDSADERPLAIFCDRLVFESESTTTTIDVGGQERYIAFEAGAYPKSTNFERSGRWFGGPDARTKLYLPAGLLADSSRLEFDGVPMDSSITMSVSVTGTQTDSVTFDTRSPTTFSLDLSV